MHGKTSMIYHNKKTIFKGIPNPFEATRYHSLIVERKTLPDCLEVIAWTKEKEIMGLKHKEFPLWGVQFHPESVLTRSGKDILANFLKIK
jgi:anthranilate synthase/aminodeoxychorismate synthase-like glutamine amidotransferase